MPGLPATLLAASLAVCRPATVRRVRPMMATYVAITAVGCDEGRLAEGVRIAFSEMERLAGILSEWDPRSAVSRVSARAGEAAVAVPPELYEVLGAGQRVAALTGGAFDVTWAALAGLWRFDAPNPRPPDPAEVAKARTLVDYRDLLLDPSGRTAFLRRKGMRIGLGGIAKGYIAAAAADLLVARGIRDVLVAASGDIAARGTNGGRPWRVAIRDPRREDAIVATIDLHDESISTAGDYERCFFSGGVRYHHILDPKTGWPARGVASVTVVGKSGVLADGLDDGLFVLGPGPGGRVAAATAGIGALFVGEDGTIRTAGELGKDFVLRARTQGGITAARQEASR